MKGLHLMSQVDFHNRWGKVSLSSLTQDTQMLRKDLEREGEDTGDEVDMR